MTQQRVRVLAGQRAAPPADAQLPDGTQSTVPTRDSFQNFLLGLGMGTDNPLSASTYGFNPISRQRQLLEWVHRGSWLGGVAVDLIADDMTRAGAQVTSKLKPDQIKEIESELTTTGTWESVNDAIKWGRLYGGALGVIDVDGQDPSTELKADRIDRGQFKGVVALDRWMLEPSLTKLIQHGPEAGNPEFYRVQSNAPAMRMKTVHHSRCIRIEGVRLPYSQRLMENLWGISVLERLWDRLVAFDSATQGAAQLTYKAHLRTYKIKGLREIVAQGGDFLNGLISFVQTMSRFQSSQGMTLLDGDDEFATSSDGAASATGIAELLIQFGQQISGALEIPLVRLFGQSPAGLNSSGESDLRTYYDGILHRQNRSLLVPMTTVYKVAALSRGIKVPPDFGIQFRPLWQMTAKEKGEVAKNTAEAVTGVYDAGLISQRTALMELQQAGRDTGTFTNITDEDVEAADPDLPSTDEPLEDEQPELPLGGGTGGRQAAGEDPPSGTEPARRADDAARPALRAVR